MRPPERRAQKGAGMSQYSFLDELIIVESLAIDLNSALHTENPARVEDVCRQLRNSANRIIRKLQEYKDATNLPKYSHELLAYKLLQHLKKPGKIATMYEWTSYIHRLQEITFQLEQALIAACISSGQHLERRIQKTAHKTAENGQQAELPPTGGQQDCIAQNAENAKQATLLCTDAEQLETRKGN